MRVKRKRKALAWIVRMMKVGLTKMASIWPKCRCSQSVVLTSLSR